MRAVQQQYESTDWDTLEQQDPSKALLYQQKLERAYAQAQNQYNDITTRQKEQQDNALNMIKTQSRQKILQNIPEWKDPKVFQKEGDLIGNILVGYGYTPQEIEQVYDPRLSLILRDFMKLKVQADKAGTTAKKLRLTPKKLPGSAPKTKKMLKKAQTDKAVKEAMNSKNIKQKVSAVSQLLANT
jgi:hypothetical protein